MTVADKLGDTARGAAERLGLQAASWSIPSDYAFVLFTVVLGTILINVWMSLKVGQARRKYNVKYPLAYAPSDHPSANQFNCIQRAHQNTIENWPTFLALLLTSGLAFPRLAALFGLTWVVARFLYFVGYSTGDPNKRYANGAMLHALAILALLGLEVATACKVLGKALK